MPSSSFTFSLDRSCSRAALRLALAAFALALLAAACGPYRPPAPEVGPWRATLEGAAGPVPFGLELARRKGGSESGREFVATIVNGDQNLLLDARLIEGGAFVIDVPHFGASIVAQVLEEGRRLEGSYSRPRRGGGEPVVMDFEAEAGSHPRFSPPSGEEGEAASAPTIEGRFALRYEGGGEALATLATRGEGELVASIDQPSGDLRYLAGRQDGRLVRLSAFDGSRALLVSARLDEEGRLVGELASGPSYVVSFSGDPVLDVEFDPGIERIEPPREASLGEVEALTLGGTATTLADAAGSYDALIVEIFGSWCPNCHDSAPWLEALRRRHADEGLRVVGLAFEARGELAAVRGQVEAFAERYELGYPLLFGGEASKEVVFDTLPFLEDFMAYPTMLIFDGEGRLVASHAGFAGPATGARHEALTAGIESLVVGLLGGEQGESGGQPSGGRAEPSERADSRR